MNNTKASVPAKISPIKSISSIWLLPFVAALIGLWMLYYQWSSQGTLITIAFDTAEGMEIGKTKIKTRNVNIGEITAISLNENADKVLITARISKNAENLLVKDSLFWVVSPKITHSGISGLSTLISGVYIEMSQGTSEESEVEFTALDDLPVSPIGTPGLHITLNSNDQFAYQKGDPILYKGLTVGQFEDVYFNFDERIVYYNAFIKAPYHQLVTSTTKFWDISGVEFNLSADGLSIKTGNIETLLTNGVTFDIPQGMPIGEKTIDRAYFDIYANYESADNERFKESVEFVILINNSIRGLNVGASVEYRGVHIGQVISTNLLVEHVSEELFKEGIQIPVLISLQPARVGLPDNEEGLNHMEQQNKLWIRHGLKATLKTGNLLTGSLFVDLQNYADQPIDKIAHYRQYPIIPTISNKFSQITAKAGEFIDNLNNLPLEKLSDNADLLLLEMTKMAKEFQLVSKNLDTLLNNANQQDLVKKLETAIKSITTLSKDFSSDSMAYEDLHNVLTSLTKTMHELTPVLNQLNNQPNSLIFNSGKAESIEPKKHTGIIYEKN